MCVYSADRAQKFIERKTFHARFRIAFSLLFSLTGAAVFGVPGSEEISVFFPLRPTANRDGRFRFFFPIEAVRGLKRVMQQIMNPSFYLYNFFFLSIYNLDKLAGKSLQLFNSETDAYVLVRRDTHASYRLIISFLHIFRYQFGYNIAIISAGQSELFSKQKMQPHILTSSHLNTAPAANIYFKTNLFSKYANYLLIRAQANELRNLMNVNGIRPRKSDNS